MTWLLTKEDAESLLRSALPDLRISFEVTEAPELGGVYVAINRPGDASLVRSSAELSALVAYFRASRAH